MYFITYCLNMLISLCIRIATADNKISHIEFEVFRLTEGRLELLIISVYLYFLIVGTLVCFPDTVVPQKVLHCYTHWVSTVLH
jgi:hypothetical protein